jgi:hypothetical protein
MCDELRGMGSRQIKAYPSSIASESCTCTVRGCVNLLDFPLLSERREGDGLQIPFHLSVQSSLFHLSDLSF